MKKLRIFSFILLIFILVACQSLAKAPVSTSEEIAPYGAQTEQDGYYQEQNKGGQGESSLTSSLLGGIDRIVIMNANLTIVVEEPIQKQQLIAEMANTYGGYVVSMNSYRTTLANGVEVPEARITIRVPAEKLTEVIGKIKAFVQDPAIDILVEDVQGQDVTKEYVDLNSRLRNLEQTEQDLQRIMDQATKTEDILIIYNQIASIREQIEILQGQINYYKEAAALSSISVTLIAQASVKPLTIGGWQPAGVARDAIQTLINVLKFIGNALIYIVLFCLPTLLIIAILFGAPAWIAWRTIRKYRTIRRNRNSLPTDPQDEISER